MTRKPMIRAVRRLFSAVAAALVLSGAAVSPTVAQEHTLNFRNADIQAFIDDVSLVTGYTFIVDSEVRGNVTITSQTPLTADEVFQVFLSTLRTQGYAAVRTSVGVYQIVPEADGARSARPATDAQGDQFVTSVVRLRNASARDAIRSIGPMLSASGAVNADQDSNMVVILDFASNVREIERVLRQLDADTSVVEMVELENISADDMTRIIERLRSATRSGEDDRRFAVTVAAVPSSNALLLRGEPNAVREMMALAARVDAVSQSNQSFRVLYLNHADGASLLPIVEQVSRSLSGTGETAQPGNRRAPSIAFHAPTNALILNADPDQIRELELVIRQLDVRRPQVLVEAIIVEISDRAARDLGVEFLVAGDGDDAVPFASTRYGGGPDLLALTGAFTFGDDENIGDELRDAAVNSLLGTSGALIGAGGQFDDGTLFGVILNALEQDTDSNVLSKPSLLTLDNQEASIIVGQEIPITTGEALGNNNANPFRTIERQDVGIQLEVRPTINEGDTIRLYIRQEVSSVAGPVSQNSVELITNQREITTTVLADDGEIIVLGGLIERDDQYRDSGIPGLKEIPGVGRLFSSESRSELRRNLMVFIRPTIVRSAEDARAVTERDYDFITDAQRTASRGAGSSLEEIVDFMLSGADPFDAPPEDGN